MCSRVKESQKLRHCFCVYVRGAKSNFTQQKKMASFSRLSTTQQQTDSLNDFRVLNAIVKCDAALLFRRSTCDLLFYAVGCHFHSIVDNVKKKEKREITC